MSVGFHGWRFPSTSAPNINEVSNKDIAASLHRNVLSRGVWRGQEEKESVSLRAITHSAHSQTADSGLTSGVSNSFKPASAPDVAGTRSKAAFSSITLASRKVSPSGSTSQEASHPSFPKQHVKVLPPLKLPEKFGGRTSSIPRSQMRVSNSQLDERRWKATTVAPNELRQVYSPDDGLAGRDGGKRMFVQPELKCTEGDREQDVTGVSFMKLPSQPSYRSCVHYEVPLRSTSSVVFLDKSLSISLMELRGRRGGQPISYRSTLSVRLGVSSCHRSSTGNKPTKTNEGNRRSREDTLGHNKYSSNRGNNSLTKHLGRPVKQPAPAQGVNSKTDDSDTQLHSNALGLLSFRGPSPSNTKAGRQKGNVDEGAFLTPSNFRHRQHSVKRSPVDSRTWSKQTKREKTEELDSFTESSNVALDEGCLRTKVDSMEDTAKTLSLKEALELFRPDFISRSQGRVRKMEQRAMRRRALKDSNQDLVQGLREVRCKQKRNCTTPDPLSDNLFKPRERSISGREMQLRSRRIYNKLPEVTKKKEEEKKRVVSQTNRLRAEVFKKRLLDQILQK